MVQEIKTTEEFQSFLDTDKLVVVEFFATWCGPCKMLAPILDKFAAKFTDAQFCKVEVDVLPHIAQSEKVTSMPTLIFYKSKEEVKRVVGADPALIQKAITAHV